MIVFNRGTPNGLNASTPIGGQQLPNSILGAKLLWKKAQKKDKKNITSDTMKRIIPQRRPFSTIELWRPWNLPSRDTSRHHWLQTTSNKNTLKSKIINNFSWNHETKPDAIPNPAIAANNGQGDSSTKW